MGQPKLGIREMGQPILGIANINLIDIAMAVTGPDEQMFFMATPDEENVPEIVKNITETVRISNVCGI